MFLVVLLNVPRNRDLLPSNLILRICVKIKLCKDHVTHVHSVLVLRKSKVYVNVGFVAQQMY